MHRGGYSKYEQLMSYLHKILNKNVVLTIHYSVLRRLYSVSELSIRLSTTFAGDTVVA